jgi:Protein of unknown function (DUF2511)
VLALLASCSGKSDDHTVNAERAQVLGGQWPFSVPSGTVDCQPKGSAKVVTFTPTGSDTVYAVNGAATSAGYQDLGPIWLDDPAVPGAKINISWLTDYGLAICG